MSTVFWIGLYGITESLNCLYSFFDLANIIFVPIFLIQAILYFVPVVLLYHNVHIDQPITASINCL